MISYGEGPVQQDEYQPWTREQERAAFASYNYCRMQAASYRDLMTAKQRLDDRLVRPMLAWTRESERIEKLIAEQNLGLVMAMLGRKYRNLVVSLDPDEMIQEGNLALLRSVDGFDYTRGIKFSTYCCMSVAKSFSRLQHRTVQRREIAHDDEKAPVTAQTDWNEKEEHIHHMTDLQEIVRQNRAGLSGIQAEVLKHRFGLGRDGTKEKTLEQVGYLVGVTKERVRQIQNRALIQIRAQMESKSIDQLIEENPDLAKKYYGSAQAAQIERAASG